ncbi:MAG: hypothetical protein IPM06_17955 [Rhizobiales bacterium]|nr:hypothetical protein [Hyphomicrobiales bacterium]
MAIFRLIRVSESGRRIGESHPRAILTDADVDTIRAMHEDEGKGYKTISKYMTQIKGRRISRGLVWKVCKYRTRAEHCADVKTVEVV